METRANYPFGVTWGCKMDSKLAPRNDANYVIGTNIFNRELSLNILFFN